MRGGIRQADGLWLVIETVPLAESSLQIHADIWSRGTGAIVSIVTVNARVLGAG